VAHAATATGISMDCILDRFPRVAASTLYIQEAMPLRRFSVRALTALLVTAVCACATSPSATSSGTGAAGGAASASADPASDNVIRIDVNHNRSDGGTTTIYVEPAAGVRTTLGTIGQGERKVFEYHVEASNRNIKLIALNSMGQTMTSTPITVPRGAGVVWDLQINSIRTRR
jgi:hypothetical protein